MKLLCVQHHPEASPGPVHSSWVFDAFLETLNETLTSSPANPGKQG